ncbi:MAG: ABC oligo/dipeptide transport, ATP-binding protein [Lentisphaerae bacterium GWF2_45_14]|nr:MAG: ABC oligo/dipeptide transport, ATP-binding protein [Lentisphaerae bacterium GWF2_45_14]
MHIEKIAIKKFRGFNNVEFKLGSLVTVIAGQNGTQKTTVLGLLSQPFSIASKKHPMYNQQPLCGGNFKSSFAEKFKFSENFDKAGEHEWTLYQKDEREPFTLVSEKRTDGNGNFRFWRKGKRKAGSGYIKLPVIYLSLKRLLPIGEDADIKEDSSVILTETENDFFQKWHNKILILNNVLEKADYISSQEKNTIGVNTTIYDWKLNSAGQDNVGKILLAILSFKRLKDKYPNDYKGGILAIDELDATLYPGSQIELLRALRNFAAEYNIQVIFTTHSLTLLEKACQLQQDPKIANQVNVVFFEKCDNNIQILENLEFQYIRLRLKVLIEDIIIPKISVFTEDNETIIFAKAILKTKCSRLNFIKASFSSSNLIELASKVPAFKFPHAIIILDGDVKSLKPLMKKIASLENILILPSEQSPERLIANYLNTLSDTSDVWRKIDAQFRKDYCFKDYSISEINADRDKAKKWFNLHLKYWKTNATKVINPWIAQHGQMANKFLEDFAQLFSKLPANKKK